jgi:hypothetical protein
MRMSQISNEDFAHALKVSIKKSGLFSRVDSEPSSYYRLQAYIGKLDQPVFAMASTVAMEVGYALTDLRSKETIWKKSIASTYTAELKEAYIGVKRLRLANEGAARENIRLMLEEISALSLPYLTAFDLESARHLHDFDPRSISLNGAVALRGCDGVGRRSSKQSLHYEMSKEHSQCGSASAS